MQEALFIVLLAVLLALSSTLLTDRRIATAMKPRWAIVVAAWVFVSSAAILLLLLHYSSLDPAVSFNAWHADGIFKVLAFVFWNSVLVSTVNMLVLGVLAFRRRGHPSSESSSTASMPLLVETSEQVVKK